MILDKLFKNLIYDPVSVLGLLVFYILLVNLPISLGAVFKKKSSYVVKVLTILVNLLISLQLVTPKSFKLVIPLSFTPQGMIFLYFFKSLLTFKEKP